MELVRLEALDKRPDFETGDKDLNEYYFKDSSVASLNLLCVTYLVLSKNRPIAFFSLSNDAIRKETIPRSAFSRVTRPVPHEKRYRSLPAVKIGRLGISQSEQGHGTGSMLLDFLKGWFTTSNKTGCRFLLVDAYNKPKVIKFYENNGFKFLVNDKDDQTRTMYYDLIQLQ